MALAPCEVCGRTASSVGGPSGGPSTGPLCAECGRPIVGLGREREREPDNIFYWSFQIKRLRITRIRVGEEV